MSETFWSKRFGHISGRNISAVDSTFSNLLQSPSLLYIEEALKRITDLANLDLEHVSLGLNRWDSQGFVNERVWRHDSILRGQSMPRPYSNDLRARVIEAIEAGASRREVADRYELSPSVVVIWAQRWEETGSVAAKPSGGSTSPLEEHAEFLLRLIVEQPDSTLDEIVAAMRKKRIPGSRSAVWRFFERRNISFKKNFVRDGAKTRGNRPRAPALDAAARHV